MWPEQCAAAREIQVAFGTGRAITYLVGEKFINFLDAAETDEAFRKEIPAFVAAVRQIFEPWRLAPYLDIARQTERFDPADYEDPKEAEIERRRELGESTRELLLVERAREWLLGE